MKKSAIKVLLTSILAITILVLPSCCADDPYSDIIWDIAPTSFRIELTDQDGTPLNINTATDREIYDKICIEYEGEKYIPADRDLIHTIYSPESRDILAIFYGLYYCGYDIMNQPAGYRLFFGEFPRDENYTIQFSIIWPDGSSNDVKYKNEFAMKHNEPNIKGTLWVDGKKQKDYQVISHKLNE